MKRLILVLIIVPVMVSAACNLPISFLENPLPTSPPVLTTTETAPPAPSKLPATETAVPAPSKLPATKTAAPTPSKLPVTDTPPAKSSLSVVYYYFVEIESKPYPAGSVVILPDILILGPAISDKARSPEPVNHIRSALQAMIHDPRNAWTSDGLGIASITFKNGAVDAALQGEYFAPGDVVLIAARMQILMTVFSEPSVKTASITLNGKNIANLGISHPSQAKPASYAYTRAEIETFMANNEYKSP